MKILRIIPSINRIHGGPAEGVIQISRVLAEQGHETEIVSLDLPNESWMSDLPFPVHGVGPAVTSYGYSRLLIPWLRQNAACYDHIVVHGLWQFPSFAAWLTLRSLGLPYLVYTHGMLDPWFKKTYPLKHLKKCLYWPWAEYRVLRDALGVCFTCEEERILARQSFQPYRCREIVVNYGTSAPVGDAGKQRAMFLAEFPELQGKRLLLFLSRIHVKKGCDLLLKAFAQIAGMDPALHLVMAGPDLTGWIPELERQAKSLGITDRITWPGMLTGDLKQGAFHAAEAFVLPSHQENFGIAVAEALACGLPVLISSKVNIWREIIEDGAGFVAEDDEDGTRDLLQKWLAATPSEKEEMSRSAVRCFERRFEISQAAQSFLAALGRSGREDAGKRAGVSRT